MKQDSIQLNVPNDGSKRRYWVDVVHSGLAAWIILIFSLIITVAAWSISSDYAEERALDRFNFRASEAEMAIKKRMLEYEQMLRGGVGLFNASEGVSRSEWRTYVSTLAIDLHYPGVQGVGFSLWISPKNKEKHIREIRAEGFPQYFIKPEGERDQYTAIIYLEPFSDRNLRAFGFDMYSEATRREAMLRALETGNTAMSGRVTLLQETNKDVQYGFLMYLPVYRKPSTTIEERRNNLIGFVYSPFRIRDLMTGILGSNTPEIQFEIYDSPAVDQDRLMLSTGTNDRSDADENSNLELIRHLEIAGHTWTVRFEPTEYFSKFNSTNQPMIVAIGGVVIDVLLFMIILSLAKLRKNATMLAVATAQKLGEREQHFKAISDTANDGIVSADDKGKITYVNRAMEKMFGYQEQEILGKPVDMLIPSEYREKHTTAFEQFIKKSNPIAKSKTSELLARKKTSETFPIELSLASWVSNGKMHVNAVVRDITERRKVERMKSEFISTVSHELRTPLTAIGGSLSLINGGATGDVPKEMSELLSTAQRNVDRLATLINDILDIEKIEDGAMSMTLQKCNLDTLIRKTIDDNRAIALKGSVELKVEKIDPVNVSVDPNRFHQVMTNLLSNAIKFSPAGQVVTVSAAKKGETVRICVKDQGSGIPLEFRQRMFNKFAQADSSDRREKGGTGLGLSITKALVERFRGTISYESEPGSGTTFFVDLPLAA